MLEDDSSQASGTDRDSKTTLDTQDDPITQLAHGLKSLLSRRTVPGIPTSPNPGFDRAKAYATALADYGKSMQAFKLFDAERFGPALEVLKAACLSGQGVNGLEVVLLLFEFYTAFFICKSSAAYVPVQRLVEHFEQLREPVRELKSAAKQDLLVMEARQRFVQRCGELFAVERVQDEMEFYGEQIGLALLEHADDLGGSPLDHLQRIDTVTTEMHLAPMQDLAQACLDAAQVQLKGLRLDKNKFSDPVQDIHRLRSPFCMPMYDAVAQMVIVLRDRGLPAESRHALRGLFRRLAQWPAKDRSQAEARRVLRSLQRQCLCRALDGALIGSMTSKISCIDKSHHRLRLGIAVQGLLLPMLQAVADEDDVLLGAAHPQSKALAGWPDDFQSRLASAQTWLRKWFDKCIGELGDGVGMSSKASPTITTTTTTTTTTTGTSTSTTTPKAKQTVGADPSPKTTTTSTSTTPSTAKPPSRPA